jgi:hypothetical protein
MHRVSDPFVGATVSMEVIRPKHEAGYATTTKVEFLNCIKLKRYQYRPGLNLRAPGGSDSQDF